MKIQSSLLYYSKGQKLAVSMRERERETETKDSDTGLGHRTGTKADGGLLY